MIQSNSNSNIVSSDFSSSNFSIEVNASMFQMLTSNVYQDSILAVMREWSTNAIDGCIAANQPIHFEVHLPTDTELYFSVRDHGIGLSQQDLVTLFCTLGASTKRTSNDFNGTFG